MFTAAGGRVFSHSHRNRSVARMRSGCRGIHWLHLQTVKYILNIWNSTISVLFVSIFQIIMGGSKGCKGKNYYLYCRCYTFDFTLDFWLINIFQDSSNVIIYFLFAVSFRLFPLLSDNSEISHIFCCFSRHILLGGEVVLTFNIWYILYHMRMFGCE